MRWIKGPLLLVSMLAACALTCCGCAAGKPSLSSGELKSSPASGAPAEPTRKASHVKILRPATHAVQSESPPFEPEHLQVAARTEDESGSGTIETTLRLQEVPPVDEVGQLVQTAWANNPSLSRMARNAEAAWDRTRIVKALPDPMIGTNVFGHPIETAAGSQRANLSFSQMVPWLEKLTAREQQAIYEAMAMDQMFKAAQLQIETEVKTAYYKLYEARREMEIVEANRSLLESVLELATARVALDAPQGDVLLATVELGKLEERRLALRQKETSQSAELNRLLNRPAGTPTRVPVTIPFPEVAWEYQLLLDRALMHQPEIEVARLKTHATTWGIEIASLQRKPDVQLNMNWFFIDDNRHSSPIVSVGEDAWSVGAMVTVPLWREKNDAIESEAIRKHQSANAEIEDVTQKYQSRIFNLLDQVRTAERTIELYRDNILPQSRQTLDSDQQAYAESRVEFDRVIQDLRNVLELEIGYHRAVTALAISLARLEQATGSVLVPVEE